MRKSVLFCFAIALVASGCRDKKGTPNDDVVRRQSAIIMKEIEKGTGMWSKYNNIVGFGAGGLDIDGDGIKEILIYAREDRVIQGAYWWLQYYKDGTWHLVSKTPFMQVNDWHVYYRTNDVKNLPRLFKQSGDSAEAVIFDKEKGTVTLEPFDRQAFEDLLKQGVLIYEGDGN